MEIILFLNEAKEGEKSTHNMIKKHDHRKHNRQVLKLPKSQQKTTGYEGDSIYSSNYESDASNTQEKGKAKGGETMSISSSTNEKNSSSVTKLSKIKAEQKIKRGEGGNIELDNLQAKTSEIQGDDNGDDDDGKELTEEEIKQRERE